MTTQTPDVVAEIRGIAAKQRVRQADLAAILNTSRMAIVRRMNGSVPFTADELIKLSRALDVPVGSFFGEHAASP